MRADTHDGPEQRLHTEAEYIDAALTFVSLPTSSCDARPDHTSWHFSEVTPSVSSGSEYRTFLKGQGATVADPQRTLPVPRFAGDFRRA
jgi:hypothetical protein